VKEEDKGRIDWKEGEKEKKKGDLKDAVTFFGVSYKLNSLIVVVS
jgi:hypothetical protein